MTTMIWSNLLPLLKRKNFNFNMTFLMILCQYPWLRWYWTKKCVLHLLTTCYLPDVFGCNSQTSQPASWTTEFLRVIVPIYCIWQTLAGVSHRKFLFFDTAFIPIRKYCVPSSQKLNWLYPVLLLNILKVGRISSNSSL